MSVRGFWQIAVLGLVVFAIIFDALILGAILHGADKPSSTITGQAQGYPDANSDGADFIDLLPPSPLVELPLIPN